jgi:NAD(P)H dehydrogenase (quinone)
MPSEDVPATGRRVAEMLLRSGFAVRAFVRSQDDRSKYLRSLGAEIVIGDLLDIAAVGSAFQGISRAYFCYPVREDFLEAASIFAIAARENRLDAVVHLSQGSAFEGLPKPRFTRTLAG